jgi:hypothetical protein
MVSRTGHTWCCLEARDPFPWLQVIDVNVSILYPNIDEHQRRQIYYQRRTNWYYHDIRLISTLWHWKICYLATSTQMPTTWLNVKCYSLVCICCYSRQPVLHDNMHRFKLGWQGLYQVFTTVVQIFYQQVTIDKVCYKLLWWNHNQWTKLKGTVVVPSCRSTNRHAYL